VHLIGKTNIGFISKRYFFFAVSLLLILAGIVSLILRGGPNYGIDFRGGILVQFSFDKAIDFNIVRKTLNDSGISGIDMQSSGTSSIILRAKKTEQNPDEFAAKVKGILAQKFPDRTITLERTEFVGATVGKHLVKQATLAILLSFLGIIIYVAFRFSSGVWGTAGVIALVHDVFITFGIFSILNKEINLTIVAALLTLAGYSINDTIVIFDRIRENLRLKPKEDLGSVIDISVNETLSRSIITNLTVFFVVIVLFFFGGEVLHDFSLALLIGVTIGSYSTIFIASPMIYEWEISKRKRAKAALSYKSKR